MEMRRSCERGAKVRREKKGFAKGVAKILKGDAKWDGERVQRGMRREMQKGLQRGKRGCEREYEWGCQNSIELPSNPISLHIAPPFTSPWKPLCTRF